MVNWKDNTQYVPVPIENTSVRYHVGIKDSGMDKHLYIGRTEDNETRWRLYCVFDTYSTDVMAIGAKQALRRAGAVMISALYHHVCFADIEISDAAFNRPAFVVSDRKTIRDGETVSIVSLSRWIPHNHEHGHYERRDVKVFSGKQHWIDAGFYANDLRRKSDVDLIAIWGGAKDTE